MSSDNFPPHASRPSMVGKQRTLVIDRTQSGKEPGALRATPPLTPRDSLMMSDKQQMEVMTRQCKELEKENAKLKNHVQQAENAIKNYRGVMSSKSSSTNNMKTSCTQTTESGLPQKLRDDQKFDSLLVESTAKSARISELEALTKKISDAAKGRDNEMVKKVQVLESSVIELKISLQTSQKALKEAETKLNAQQPLPSPVKVIVAPPRAVTTSVETSMTPVKEVTMNATSAATVSCSSTATNPGTDSEETNTHSSCTNITTMENTFLRDNLLNVQKNFLSLQVEYNNLKKSVSYAISDHKSSIHEELESILKLLTTRWEKDREDSKVLNQQLQSERDELEEEIKTEKKNAYVWKLKVNQLESDKADMFTKMRATEEQVEQLETELKLTRISVANEKLKAEAAAAAVVSPPQTSVALQTTPLGKPKTSTILFDSSCSPMPIYEQTAEKLLQSESQKKSDEIAAKDFKIGELCKAVEAEKDNYSKLQAIHSDVLSLQEVHAAEVKAVKHFYHIKDLVRIAKEREEQLEKEKLNIELNNMKEIQGVLQFSVKTAEQSLSEVQPHVVVKLVEGRQKRLKLIQQSVKGRMKDIDQRSTELCAGNSAHLQGFQKKAEENNKIAAQMTKDVTEKLLKMFTH